MLLHPRAFPKRVRHWLEQAGCDKGSVKIFTGKTIAAEQYWKTATQDPVCMSLCRQFSSI